MPPELPKSVALSTVALVALVALVVGALAAAIVLSGRSINLP